MFCGDEATHETLLALRLPRLTCVPLHDLEAAYPELRAVKATRSLAEYYWTATPATCLFTLERHSDAALVIRLDADLEVYAGMGPVLEELGDCSVLLTPHRIAPEFRDASEEERRALGGRFNVQFEVFRNDERGLTALRWWHEQCVEWCYDRFEPGRYGDQGYLDDWETRFQGVRASAHPGAGLAPWNVGRHSLSRHDGQLQVDGKQLIFHHFQSLQLHRAGRAARALARGTRAYRLTVGPVPLVWTAGWRLREAQLSELWDPYVARLSDACGELAHLLGEPPDDLQPLRPQGVAFQVLRRRIPPRIRDFYWRTRGAIWLRRGRRHAVRPSDGP